MDDPQPTFVVCFEENKDAFYERDVDLFKTFSTARGFFRKVHNGELEAVGLPVRSKYSGKRFTHVHLTLDKNQIHRKYRTWEDMKQLKKEHPLLDLNCTVMAIPPKSGMSRSRSIILTGKIGNRTEKLLCIALGALVALLALDPQRLYTMWDILTPPY